MAEINDRGTKKWTAMMLPEHEEMLRQLWQEQDYKEKPMLDEQKQMEINTQLQLAINDDLTVDIEYYDHDLRDFQKIRGRLLVIDTLAGVLKLDQEEGAVSLQDVTDVIVA